MGLDVHVFTSKKALRRLDCVLAPTNRKRGTQWDPLCGLFQMTIDGKPAVVEYEPDTDLRSTEQIPLLEEGGIEEFVHREVLPYAPSAWIVEPSIKIGYEIPFTGHFYKPDPMRSLEEIRADILEAEKETEGLLSEILGGTREGRTKTGSCQPNWPCRLDW